MVREAGSRLDGNPPGRPPAWHECRIRTRLCLQGVSRASAQADVQKQLTPTLMGLLTVGDGNITGYKVILRRVGGSLKDNYSYPG